MTDQDTSQRERARKALVADILASAQMLNRTDASRFLANSGSQGDRSELKIEVNGEPRYPAFQFDEDTHQVLPAVKTILREAPESWNALRLLDWMTRPHVEFGASPADVIRQKPQEIVAAFRRACRRPQHG